MYGHDLNTGLRFLNSSLWLEPLTTTDQFNSWVVRYLDPHCIRNHIHAAFLKLKLTNFVADPVWGLAKRLVKQAVKILQN